MKNLPDVPVVRELLIIPVGAFEQHGPHLPSTTDTLIAGILADALATAIGGTHISAIPVSCSHEHLGLGTTLAVDAATVFSYIDGIVSSGLKRGFKQVALINAHGGNYFLKNLVQQRCAEGDCVWLGPGSGMMKKAFDEAGIETSVDEDMHAGEYETSVLLAYQPEVVDMSLAKDVASAPRPLLNSLGLGAYTHSGVIGRPTLATKEKGERVVCALAELMKQELNDLAQHWSARTA